MFPQPLPAPCAQRIDLDADGTAFALLAEPPAEPINLRGRTRGTQTWCLGQPGRTCSFAADGSGGRARGRFQRRCLFCSFEALEATTASPHGRGNVVRLLKTWQRVAPEIYATAQTQSAFASLPAELQRELLASVQRPARVPHLAERHTAEEVLSWRLSVTVPPAPSQLA